MAFKLEIKNSSNSWVDITSKIALGGVKWQRNDVDGPAAGRSITGEMIRDRVATKMRMDVTCILLSEADLQSIQQLIYPEYVQVRYTDPLLGSRTVWMYANNNSAVYSHKDSRNVELWKEIVFPLIEV